MFRELLSSRLIQGALVFFVLVVGGSLLYRWRVHHTTIQVLGPIPQSMVSPTENTVPVDFQTEGVTNTSDETTETPMTETTEALPNKDDALADAFLPDVEATHEEITAEEEKAEDALSAEERRNREGRERFQNTYSKIRTLIADEGGKIDHTSPLSARVEFYHHLQELFHIIDEGSDEIPPSFRFFMNLATRMGAGGTASGDFSVSDYLNVADFMDAEGDVETANRMRAVAQRALDNGDDILKPEHFEVDP